MGEHPLLYPSCGSLWNNLRRPCEALVGSSLLHKSSPRGTGGLPKGGRIPPDYLMRPPLGVFGPFSTRKDTFQYRIVKRCNFVAILFLYHSCCLTAPPISKNKPAFPLFASSIKNDALRILKYKKRSCCIAAAGAQ